jgi:uncharacterized membrane protein
VFTTYKVLLLIHILCAMTWVGGTIMIQLLALRVVKARDSVHGAAFSRDISVVAMSTFIPASLVLVLSGFGLVHEGNWDWQGWLIFALVVWAASFLSGALYLGPQSKKLGDAIAEHGFDSQQAQVRLRNILIHSRIELLFLILVVCDMVLKPGQ